MSLAEPSVSAVLPIPCSPILLSLFGDCAKKTCHQQIIFPSASFPCGPIAGPHSRSRALTSPMTGDPCILGTCRHSIAITSMKSLLFAPRLDSLPIFHPTGSRSKRGLWGHTACHEHTYRTQQSLALAKRACNPVSDIIVEEGLLLLEKELFICLAEDKTIAINLFCPKSLTPVDKATHYSK